MSKWWIETYIRLISEVDWTVLWINTLIELRGLSLKPFFKRMCPSDEKKHVLVWFEKLSEYNCELISWLDKVCWLENDIL